MSTTDRIEFYLNKHQRPFLIVNSSFQPNDGDLISIEKVTYKVLGRSFSVDYAREPDEQVRCNVIVEERSGE